MMKLITRVGRIILCLLVDVDPGAALRVGRRDCIVDNRRVEEASSTSNAMPGIGHDKIVGDLHTVPTAIEDGACRANRRAGH